MIARNPLAFFISPHRLDRLEERFEDWRRYITEPAAFLHKYQSIKAAGPLMERPEVKAALAMVEQFKQQDETLHYGKYVDIVRYIPLNLRRVYSLGLHRTGPLSILDMGAGAGFFLYCCKAHGHDVLGFDADDGEFYAKMHEALGVRCLVQAIHPQTPLPDFGRKFDCITAFAVCFHRVGGVPWSADDWRFFLEDLLRNHCTDRGMIHLQLNDAPKGDREDVRRKITRAFPATSRGYQSVTLFKRDFPELM